MGKADAVSLDSLPKWWAESPHEWPTNVRRVQAFDCETYAIAQQSACECRVDAERLSGAALARAFLLPESSPRIGLLTQGVGEDSVSSPEDLVVLDERLNELGYLEEVGSDAPLRAHALRTFACAVSGTHRFEESCDDGIMPCQVAGVRCAKATQQDTCLLDVPCAGGTFVPQSEVHQWLRSRNAPGWLELPSAGIGFERIGGVMLPRYATSWLVDALSAAGRFFAASHPDAPPIRVTTASLSRGGLLPDAADHQSGLQLRVEVNWQFVSAHMEALRHAGFDGFVLRASHEEISYQVCGGPLHGRCSVLIRVNATSYLAAALPVPSRGALLPNIVSARLLEDGMRLVLNGSDLGRSTIDVAAVGIGGVVCTLQSHTPTGVVAMCNNETQVYGRPWLTTISGGHGTGGDVVSRTSNEGTNGTAPYRRMIEGIVPTLRGLLAAGGGGELLSQVGIAQAMVDGAIVSFRESLFSAPEMLPTTIVFARTAQQLATLGQMRPMAYRLAVAVEQFAALNTLVGAGTDGLGQSCEWAQRAAQTSSDVVLRLTELDWIRELSKAMLATAARLDEALRAALSSLERSIELQAGLDAHFNQMLLDFKSLPLSNLVLASDALAQIDDETFSEVKATLDLLIGWMREQLPSWQTLDAAMQNEATKVATVLAHINDVFNVLADKPTSGEVRIGLVFALRTQSEELRKSIAKLPPNLIGATEVVRIIDALLERLPSVFRILEQAKGAINTAGSKVQGVTQGAVDSFAGIYERQAALLDAAQDLRAKSETDVNALLQATRGVSQALLHAVEDNLIGSGSSVSEELLDGPRTRERFQEMLSVTGLVNKTLHDVVSLADSQKPLLDLLQSTSELSSICTWNASTEARAPNAHGLLDSIDKVHSMLNDATTDVSTMSDLAALQQCVADAGCSTSLIVKLMQLRLRLKTARTSLLALEGFDSGAAEFALDLVKKLEFVDRPPDQPLEWERPVGNYTATSPRVQFGIAAKWAFILPTNGDVPDSVVPDAAPLALALARGNCHDLAARSGAASSPDGACGPVLRSSMHSVLFGAQEASALLKEARVALRFEHSAPHRGLNSNAGIGHARPSLSTTNCLNFSCSQSPSSYLCKTRSLGRLAI